MKTPTSRSWRIFVVGIAAAAAVVPLPPGAVDRLYSAKVYATLQPLLTSLSNVVTVSLLDIAIVGVVVLWIVFATRDLLHTTSRIPAGLHIVARTVVWAAV